MKRIGYTKLEDGSLAVYSEDMAVLVEPDGEGGVCVKAFDKEAGEWISEKVVKKDLP